MIGTKRQLIEALHASEGDLDELVEICFPGDEPGVHHDYAVKEVSICVPASGEKPSTVIVAGEYISGGGL